MTRVQNEDTRTITDLLQSTMITAINNNYLTFKGNNIKNSNQI